MADTGTLDNKAQNLILDEIDQGRCTAMINRELRKVINDIADPNKLATKERELVLKIKFKPNKQRNAAGVSYSVSHKPAGYVTTEESDIHLGKDKVTGEYFARPFVPNQQRLFEPSDDSAAPAADDTPAN